MSRKKNRKPKKVVYRSAINGQFVTQKFAKKNPRTTVKERR
jgi:hypothetical protein